MASYFEELKGEVEVIETSYRPPSEEGARWFLDFDKFIWELRAKLLGGYLIQDKNGYYKIVRPKGAKPFMNMEGVEDTVSIAKFLCNKIHGLTILTEERVLELAKEFYIKLAKLYYVNMEKYQLTPAKASVVIRMVVGLFESTLRKSIGGMSMRLIGQTERVVETRAEPKRKKILGII